MKRNKVIDNLIKKHLNWHKTDLRMASTKYFVDSGTVSGSLYAAIHDIAEQYAEQKQQPASALAEPSLAVEEKIEGYDPRWPRVADSMTELSPELEAKQEEEALERIIKELPEHGIDTSDWEYKYGDNCYTVAEFIARAIKDAQEWREFAEVCYKALSTYGSHPLIEEQYNQLQDKEGKT
jgi:hypothetical protein